MLKKKEYFEEIKKLDYKELDYKIIMLKKLLISYRIKLKTKQKIEPHKIKQTKKQIAQILTRKTLYKNKR
uniref:Large ribosomal subunit protein uL29c n=1 Tax=Caloglossa monosticha TaxID=76906 RepID=A0A1Z1M4U8_9FLOR|nr:ribosomal protein L29 [Caloglossa monosticha]ARW61088.1 ribosomal protein L29 [Caloglossa monosticha]